MKNHRGNGLVYRTDVGTVSIYDMYVKNRVVFHVAVDNDEQVPVIQIAKPGETTYAPTRGRAQKREFIVRDEDGDAKSTKVRVDSGSIQSFIYPRLAEFLTALYVPTLDADVDVPDDLSGLTD